MRLLLADDDADLLQLLRMKLTEASFQVDAVATTAELLDRAGSVRYDLIVTERDFREVDGLEAIRSLRSKGVSAPILIVTARGSIEDRVRGLDSGADDYLIKPFNVVEFLARVRALLRRPYGLLGPVLRCGKLELDEATGEVRCSGSPLELRPSERRLLALLMRRGGAVLSKLVIENAVSERAPGNRLGQNWD
jgi:DNA-binding response OmpR family regulator